MTPTAGHRRDCGYPNMIIGFLRYVINDGTDTKSMVLSGRTDELISGAISSEYQKDIVRGLAKRYAHYIECFFTHGPNGMGITDTNRLIYVIADSPVCDMQSNSYPVIH